MRTDEIFALIQKQASAPVTGEERDFNAMEYSGGNYDDTYSLGKVDGAILFARELLRLSATQNPKGPNHVD